MLGKFPLALLGLTVGSGLTVLGFVAYFLDNATLNLVGFFYGIPVLLGGFALKAAELAPVPYSQPTTPDVLTLRQQQATAIQTQIRKDVTRYRYGQKAHLDSSLSYLGLSPQDEERPVLTGLREVAIDNAYALVLEFESPFIPLETWQQKQEKIASFFGPSIRAQVEQRADQHIEVALIAVPPTSV